MIRLQDTPIRIEELIDAVRRDDDGAVALFIGTVREHNRGRRVLWLEYQAYAEMAEPELAGIAARARAEHGAARVAVVHRLGRLSIGEASVAVAVAAPHRREALLACRFVIDSLKASVPIWKKEVFEGGEVWIEGEGDAPAEGSQS